MYRLTRLSLSYPKLTLLVVALVTAVLGVGLTRLRTEFGYRVLIGDEHPSVRALDAFIAQFGGGLPARIAWECGEGQPCNTVFDPSSLEMAFAVTNALSPLAGIQNVEGPATAALLVPSPGGFAARRFVDEGELAPDAAALAARALDDPLWVDTFVSKSGRVGVIVVQPSDTAPETDVLVTDAIEKALAPFEARGFTFYVFGDPVENVIGGRDLAQSSTKLVPATISVIVLVLFALSRSWRAVAVATGTMGIGLLWTFGLLGWLGWPRDGILEVLAPLIVVVGVCDAIHMLSRYSAEVAERSLPDCSGTRAAVLVDVARDVAPPCLITSLTTAAAFLSFVTSALATFVRFGTIAAFGVAACLVLTFTMLPVLVRALPARGAKAAQHSAIWDVALDAILRVSKKRAVPILLTAMILCGVCSIGWFGRLTADTDWLDSWGEHSRIVKAIRFAEAHFQTSASLELEVALAPETALEDPETLRTIDEFSQFLSTVHGLGSATSVLDLVKRVNRLLRDDDPAFERVAETRAANAEALELIALEGPELLGSWVSLDRSRLRISVEASNQSHLSRVAGLEAVRRYARSVLPESWSVRLSGEYAITVDWVRDVQRTQLRSFPTALVLVLAMVAVFLRSLRLALAAMVPTLLPVVVTLGTMGWAGMSLDVGRAMIAAVMIGIGVDDSIHLLHQYQRRRAAGKTSHEAIRGAVLHVGRAVVTTSLALSLGFLTLMASAWQTIASFGLFVSIAILGALVATLFVLPALVFVAEPTLGRLGLSKEWSGRAAAEYHRSRSSCTD